ncbi:apolipoprotein N-acyltransferase [Streptomyces sp. NPDC048718]|uniref:apolipoprotein N-acyltransferase n=1 Tax=Streptomyces sp. NPDC048718 TaxID=3365587 RepID=UPI00372300C2
MRTAFAAKSRARPTRGGRWAGTGRSLLALVLGALPVFAFPTPGLWWWAYVSLVPLLLLIRTAPTARRAGFDGWCGGAGFMLAVHHWLLSSLHVFLFVLAALFGLLWLPWGRLVRTALRGMPTPARACAALVLVPSGWLMIELVRSWQALGGPWGLLGASQWQVPPALRLASAGGVWLLSLLVVAANTAVALLVIALARARRSPRARRTALAGAAGVLDCVLLLALAPWLFPAPHTSGSVRIGVVQPGVFDGPGGATRRFDRGERLTRTLAGKRLDLVVWGESSVGTDLRSRPDLAARLAALVREVGAPVLVNVDAHRSDRPGIYKSAVLIGADGPTGQRYDKMRLVPFGEYIPLRSLLGWATSVGKAAAVNRRRGTTPVVMTLPPVPGGTGMPGLRIGPLICFETAFPDMSRHLADMGAQVIVAQSATSTFQNTWAPAQHASLGALRAAETGRPMVHATLTGISAAYAPDGRRTGPVLGTDLSTTAVYTLPLSRTRTPYDRLGPWPVYAAALALAVAAGAVVSARLGAARRARSEPGQDAPENP